MFKWRSSLPYTQKSNPLLFTKAVNILQAQDQISNSLPQALCFMKVTARTSPQFTSLQGLCWTYLWSVFVQDRCVKNITTSTTQHEVMKKRVITTDSQQFGPGAQRYGLWKRNPLLVTAPIITQAKRSELHKVHVFIQLCLYSTYSIYIVFCLIGYNVLLSSFSLLWLRKCTICI